MKFAIVLMSLGAMSLSACGTVTLSNDQVTAAWKLTGGGLAEGTVVYKPTGATVRIPGDLFTLVMTDGTFLRSSQMQMAGSPRVEDLAAKPGASRLAERLGGKQVVVELAEGRRDLRATWRAVLRDGSRYLRQEVTLQAGAKPVPIKDIVLLDFPVANARTSGSVDGSPVVTETAFFAVEHPLSVNRGEIGCVRCFLPRGTPLAAGERLDVSSVIGFAAPTQMRRDFLAYLERERAHPYRPFLNYNTWYDLGFSNKFDEANAVDVINAIGQELVVKRHVKMDSFLLDDGWDDPQTLWRPHKGFPNGFGSLAAAAEKYGAEIGFWLSPWGGYDKPKEERIAAGRQQGFEIANGSFSMAGPKYYERFRSLCVDVVKKYGANQFKFDGIGAGSGEGAGSAIRDFQAMLKLVDELRSIKPDIYINQTTGTWPSPFWLMHADSIWRGGEDHSFATGAGPDRQRWITYRDGDVHERIVSRTELFPLNSLMLHGMIFARSAEKLNVDPNGVFTSEVRSFFGSGTQMQEMYITPKLLSADNWDALAAAANWSRQNADVLCDTHWVGGDPQEKQVYGWAAWSPRKGILTLRNPSIKPKSIAIDVGKAFELPPSAAKKYTLSSPYKDQRPMVTELTAGKETTFELKPFEVLVFDAIPQAGK